MSNRYSYAPADKVPVIEPYQNAIHQLPRVFTMMIQASTRTPTDFAHRCYDLLSTVPCGYVVTYKDIASALGAKAYRAVGQAMKHNPKAPDVPCHRVVNEDGRLGGYRYGLEAKIAILEKENIRVNGNRIVDFSAKRWQFDRS